MKRIKSHKDLEVFSLSYKLAMEIYNISKKFPIEERYSMTDQIRRSSRSVSANLAESFRKRRYAKAFIAKLSDAESEAAETQVWLDFAYDSGHLSSQFYKRLFDDYNRLIGKIVTMINQPNNWII